MSDLPERKVLKNLLAELKSRTIASTEDVKEEQDGFFEQVSSLFKKITHINEESGDELREVTGDFANLFGIIVLSLRGLMRCVNRNREDTRLYIKALEDYSVELDNTLTQIFEQAKKQAEDQMKENEQLRKRTSPEYTI